MSFLSRGWQWFRDQFEESDDSWDDYEEEAPYSTADEDTRPPAGSTPARAIQPLETIVMIPSAYRDARRAVDNLEKGLVVILVLQDNVDDTTASRFVDFMSGAVYLAKGDMKLINDNVLVCVPSTVRLETDLFAFHSGIPTWRGPDL
jgi:cell division inhibitor SepF